MITSIDVVKNRLPYLDFTVEAVANRVNSVVLEVKYTLQVLLNKTDLEVEDLMEAAYTNQQRILVGVYAAYLLVKRKAFAVAAGDAETGEQASGKTLKKAKADTVEAEFMLVKASDGASIQLNTSELLQHLLDEICQKAALLGIVLPICPCQEGIPSPFVVVPWC